MTSFRGLRDLLLWTMLWKEFLQLARDRLTFAMILGIPTMQLLLFGFAINLDIRHIDAAIVDQAQTARSREVAATLEATGLLALRDVPAESPQQLVEALRQGKISVGIVLPPDLDRRLELRDRPALQVMVDGSDQTSKLKTPLVTSAALRVASDKYAKDLTVTTLARGTI